MNGPSDSHDDDGCTQKVSQTRTFTNEQFHVNEPDTSGSNVDSFDELFNLVLVGNAAVGKSSIVARFADNEFQEKMPATVGIDFKVRHVTLEGKRISMRMWDTAGQEKFRAITSSYYRGAHGAMIVYDVTDRNSFANLGTWIAEVDKHAMKGVRKMIIGNKVDLSFARTVSLGEAQKYARNQQTPYMETSAKTSDGIIDAFGTLAWHINTHLENKRKSKMQRSATRDNDDCDEFATVALNSVDNNKKRTSKCNC